MTGWAEPRAGFRAVMTAARQLGHDPHPWVTGDNGWQVRSACRCCGMQLGASIGPAGVEAEGPATIRECEGKVAA